MFDEIGKMTVVIGNCGQLRVLWLNINSELSGTIPSEIGQLGLVEGKFAIRQ